MSSNNNSLILESINQVFINHLENIEQDTISYLVASISESTSQQELEDSVTSVIIDFGIESDIQNATPLMKSLVSTLRKKGCLDFADSNKPLADHLVCQIVKKEPRLDDPNLTMEQYLELTRSKSPQTRKLALRNFCPCKVKKDIDLLWNRIMEMAQDEDPKVRYQVLHNCCDGSPLWREDDVIKTIESMHNDNDPKIRRTVHNILNHYKRTGTWNIL